MILMTKSARIGVVSASAALALLMSDAEPGRYPLGFPKMPEPAENISAPAKIELGKKLQLRESTQIDLADQGSVTRFGSKHAAGHAGPPCLLSFGHDRVKHSGRIGRGMALRGRALDVASLR
jgi:hypothetical protein